MPPSSKVPVIGIVGWKNSGKTTLTVRLVEEFTRRGLKVATVKHTHHELLMHDEDTDSARHQRAGAAQVALVSPQRWMLVTELKDAPQPALDEVIAALAPADLVIVEGYKSAAIPKIEVRRQAARNGPPLAGSDPDVIAVAADHACDGGGRPVFPLDDIPAIAAFIGSTLGLHAC